MGLAILDDWDTFRSLVIFGLREDPSFAQQLAQLTDRIETKCLQLGVEPAPKPQTSSQADREALIALYNATDGPNWKDKDNWLSDAPIGEWHGVTTDGRGRVIGVNLVENQLSGVIPPELGNLVRLRRLELDRNQLRGEIPPEFGNLASLSVLNLSSNRLSGGIPPKFGDLASLTGLRLDGNQLSGCVPDSLRYRLDMDYSDLGGLPFCTTREVVIQVVVEVIKVIEVIKSVEVVKEVPVKVGSGDIQGGRGHQGSPGGSRGH